MAVINDIDQKHSLIGKSLFGLKPQVTVHYRKGSHSASLIHIAATNKSSRENTPMLLSGLPLAQVALFIPRQSRLSR